MIAERGVWCLLGEPGVTGVAATAGFDWVCLDAQHGLFDRGRMTETLARRTDDWAPVLVRTPSADPAFIGAALDAGASGVIVPLIDDVQQARRAVEAACYPPLGGRSWGPLTPLWQQSAPSPEFATTEVWVMLETPAGLAAADPILRVTGVTGVFVGPFDLALGLGTSLDELLRADGPDVPLPRIARAARDAGVAAGAFAGDVERAAVLAGLGFDRIAITTDAALIGVGAAAVLGTSTSASSTY